MENHGYPENDLTQPSLIRKIFKAGKTCEQTGISDSSILFPDV